MTTLLFFAILIVLFIVIPIAIVWPLIRDMTDDELTDYARRMWKFDYMNGRL